MSGQRKKEKNGLHVVLDIDGTLIDHGYAPVHLQPAGTINGEEVFFRPHLLSFLEFCFDECETVSIWTAAHESWMRGFIALLPEEMQDKFLFTWHCDRVRLIRNPFDRYDIVCLKDLNKVWRTRLGKDNGVGKHNTLIVEDTRENCSKNFGNAIYVSAFSRWLSKHDNILKHLTRYIRCLAKKPTVRTTEKRGWYKQMLSNGAESEENEVEEKGEENEVEKEVEEEGEENEVESKGSSCED